MVWPVPVAILKQLRATVYLHTCHSKFLGYLSPPCWHAFLFNNVENAVYQEAFLVFLLRYYFKKASDEFACGAVFEEIWEDETVLPMYEGRILGKVERID